MDDLFRMDLLFNKKYLIINYNTNITNNIIIYLFF
jgi:hypothetical protein